MDNQVFLNKTFAEIYATTPDYMRGAVCTEYAALFLATIDYCGKPTDIVAVWDGNTDTHCLVLVNEYGIIL